VETPEGLRYEIVTEHNLGDLPTFRLPPYSCQYCAYWELADDSDEKMSKEQARELKRDWFRRVAAEFGDCGVIAYLNNEVVGYAQYASPRFFPGVGKYASGPPNKDSVFLACLYIPRRELRRKGIGKSLLEFVLANLQRRGYNTIETYARRGSENNPAGPLDFYLGQGFSVPKECDEFPLVRKEFGTVRHDCLGHDSPH
jgi:GNAT superfamily N-acetyltransferase